MKKKEEIIVRTHAITIDKARNVRNAQFDPSLQEKRTTATIVAKKTSNMGQVSLSKNTTRARFFNDYQGNFFLQTPVQWRIVEMRNQNAMVHRV